VDMDIGGMMFRCSFGDMRQTNKKDPSKYRSIRTSHKPPVDKRIGAFRWNPVMPVSLPTLSQFAAFQKAFEKPVKDSIDLALRFHMYRKQSKDIPLLGVETMFAMYPETKGTFYQSTLPHIICQALKLPTLLAKDGLLIFNNKFKCGSSGNTIGGRNIPTLGYDPPPGHPTKVFVHRELCLSILSAMFLGVLPKTSSRTCGMPSNEIPLKLLLDRSPQEVAKLRMLVNYFDRTKASVPAGLLEIHRVGVDTRKFDAKKWTSFKCPLQPLSLLDLNIGLEEAYTEKCLQVDFANCSLGGGVLTGGCVQEEIRFAICPELIVCMFFCPIMHENEAIHMIGGEQFSQYKGYGFGLKFGGDYKDPAPRRKDGTVLTALTAIDALDGRGVGRQFQYQWTEKAILRELNKAYAGFLPENHDSLDDFKDIATGNWGCGAFLGHLGLKAILQWIAASVAGRSMYYFPWNEKSFADGFETFIRSICPEATIARAHPNKLVAKSRVTFAGRQKPTAIVGPIVGAVLAVAKQQIRRIDDGLPILKGGCYFDAVLRELRS